MGTTPQRVVCLLVGALLVAGNVLAQTAVLVPNSAEIEQAYKDGRAAYEAGNYEVAAGHFARVVAADPVHVKARINWGTALSRGGKPETAIPIFQQALVLDPINAEAHYNWGAALARMGQHQEAMQKFDQALALKSAALMLPPPLQRSLQDYMQRHRRDTEKTGVEAPPMRIPSPR
jgi:tetratricopeptide (TPR) repeat protein